MQCFLCLLYQTIFHSWSNTWEWCSVEHAFGNISPQQSLDVLHVHLCLLSHFSHVRLFTISWTVAQQAPLSVGFSRQEYWSGLPCPPPGDLPDPEIEPGSPPTSALQVDSLPLSHQGSPDILHLNHLFY